jgi:hypothetical protein|tara:strand:+ start:11990 stop:12157 length:168 start_codon:yes stop_codon:yes gene_type:complete
MAKITLQRFNDAPVEYNQRSFSEIIRQLEQLIQALNSSYTEQTQRESTRRTWFLG